MKSDHLSWLLTYFQYHKLEQAWIIFFHDPLLDGEQENEVKGGTSSRFFFLFLFFFFFAKTGSCYLLQFCGSEYGHQPRLFYHQTQRLKGLS